MKLIKKPHMLNTILHKGRRQRKCDSSLEEKIQRYTAYIYTDQTTSKISDISELEKKTLGLGA